MFFFNFSSKFLLLLYQFQYKTQCNLDQINAEIDTSTILCPKSHLSQKTKKIKKQTKTTFLSNPLL